MALYPEQFQIITIAGLYDDQTGNPLFGAIGSPVSGGSPAVQVEAVVTAGTDDLGLIRPVPIGTIGNPVPGGNAEPGTYYGVYIAGINTAGDFTPLHFDASGNLFVNVPNIPQLSTTSVGSPAEPALNVYLAGSDISIEASGNLVNNTLPPSNNNTGVLPALAATSPTSVVYTAGNQVLLVTDLHGNLNTGAQAWGGVTLGPATPFGVAPSGNVIGTNSNLFAGGLPLSATSVGSPASTGLDVYILGGAVSISGSVAVTQSGTWTVNSVQSGPWTVTAQGQYSNNTTAATSITDNFGVLPAVVGPQVYSAGNQVLLTTDTTGNLRVLDASDVAPGSSTPPTYISVAGGYNVSTGTYQPLPLINTGSPAQAALNVTGEVIVEGTVAVTQSGVWTVGITGVGTTTFGSPAETGLNVFVVGGQVTLESNSPSTPVYVDLVNPITVNGLSFTTTGSPAESSLNVFVTGSNTSSLVAEATTGPSSYTNGAAVLLNTTLGGSLITIPADEARASSINYYTISSGNAYVAVTTAFTPIFAFQTNSASLSYLLRMLQVFTSGSVIEFNVLKNPTVTGGSFVAASGHMNYNTTATSYSAGTKVLSGYVGATPFLDAELVDAMAAGAPGDTFGIEARSFSGNASVVAAIRWSEESVSI